MFCSAIALSKLLLHAIQSNDTRLQEITVQGDQIEPETNGIRTRSKTKNSKSFNKLRKLQNKKMTTDGTPN